MLSDNSHIFQSDQKNLIHKNSEQKHLLSDGIAFTADGTIPEMSDICKKIVVKRIWINMSERGTDHRVWDIVSGKRGCRVMSEKMGTFPILLPLSDRCSFIQLAGSISDRSCTYRLTGCSFA